MYICSSVCGVCGHLDTFDTQATGRPDHLRSTFVYTGTTRVHVTLPSGNQFIYIYSKFYASIYRFMPLCSIRVLHVSLYYIMAIKIYPR